MKTGNVYEDDVKEIKELMEMKCTPQIIIYTFLWTS